MIRIGILSFAHHHGEAYISNLRQMPKGNVELVGVADDDPMRGQTIAAENRARYFHTYEDLLEEQITSAIERMGPGSLEKLIHSGDTWIID